MTEVAITPPLDAEARQHALDITRSLAVAAPAGSGKTGLLTQRVLKLLAVCDAPEEVLCITFTRKAAGEMLDRISAAIADANSKPRPNSPHDQITWDLATDVLARDKLCGWQLLKAPNRLRIQTIDGFCRSLTQQLPIASGLGAQPDTIDQVEDAYRQAVRALLKELEKDSPLSDDLFLLLGHLDNNTQQIEDLLISLLQRREQWLPLMMASRSSDAREWLQDSLKDVLQEVLSQLKQALRPFDSDLSLIADFAANQLSESGSNSPIAQLKGISGLPSDGVEDLKAWLAVSELLLTQKGEWRKKLTVKEGFPSSKNKTEKEHFAAQKKALMTLIGEMSSDAQALELLQDLRHLPATHYSEPQWQILDCLTRILLYLVAELKVVFRNLGATDFSEITQAALLALGDEDSPGDLALRLDYQIKHILVDEFQDTALPQLQLLQALTRAWQIDDGRTLFIVGDAMQSCYGFREANVGIFLNARARGIGDVPLDALDLSVNFRSRAGVVDWVNEVFSLAFPGRDDISRGAVRYSPSSSVKPALAEAAVSCHIATGDHARQDEARALVELLKARRREKPDADIAILVRNRSHLRETLDLLSEQGISWTATDIDPLSSQMAIIDLLSLTRALLYPDSRIAWLSLLRGPWCGLNNADLLVIAQANTDTANFVWENIFDHEQVPGLSQEGKETLSRIAPVLSKSLAEKRRKNCRHWIQGTWIALGGPATLHSSTDQDNVNSFFSLLSKHSRASLLVDWDNFASAIKKLYAAPKQDADSSLQVMTIHKSKGLEFDSVFIPGLDRQTRADDKSLLLWKQQVQAEGDTRLILGPLSPTGEDNDPIYHYLAQENKLKNQLEATRLLYVACTRAVEKLYLFACLTVDEKASEASDKVEFKNPAKTALLASVWPQLRQQAQPIEHLSHKPASSTSDALYLDHILRLPSQWQNKPLKSSELLAKYRGQEFTDEDNIPTPDSPAKRIAKHLGTVLHRSLQTIVEDGLEHWDLARTDKQKPFWRAQLKQMGLSAEEAEQASVRIQTAVERMLADPQGQWLLDSKHRDSACELALWHRTRETQYQSGRRESIIDRTFIHEDEHGESTRWIVDYKSNEPKSTQSQADFLLEQIEEYRPQLRRYAALMSLRESLPIRCALYFPMIQHLEIVNLDGK